MTVEKAVIVNTVTGARTPVMFNPEQYTLNREVNFAQAAVPGLSAPIVQFVNGNAQTLEMELFLDTYEPIDARRDVRTETRKVTDLMAIDPSLHAPPPVIFTWGSISFTCVLARASQQFVMFLGNGTPVRARLQVTFTEFTNVELEAKEIKRETSDYSRVHVVAQGETVSAIAGGAYDDPRLWRPIALHNGIDDPRDVPIGRSLLIPQLPYRAPETGEVMQ